MTGFGRAEAEADGTRVAWELRSVNGKGLDMRLRVPSSLDRLEAAMRNRVKARLARGNVQAALQIDADAGAGVTVNEVVAADLVAAARTLHETHGLPMPDAGSLLLMRGVLEAGPRDTSENADETVLGALDEALDALIREREREGAQLAGVLRGQIDRIAELTEAATADPAREPAAIRARLASQVARLSETELDPDRLHAEAALLAVRADLAEEIDRLRAHVVAAHALLEEGGPIGRRLDFLAQEFFREANTLCAKSNAASITAIGLELKLTIDRFREQVANIE